MFNLTDILLNAQGGEAMRNLARQFGLSPEQSRAAVEAMMPAFAAAMQRQMADPRSLQALFALMAGQPPAPRNPYLDAMAAVSPDAVAAGTAALEAIFGSSEVTRAVADQVAALSGVGQSVLQPMMPVVAAMLMAGLGANLRDNPLGQMLANFFGGAKPAPSGFGPVGDMVATMMRDSAEKGPAAFADVMGQMMKAMPRPTGGTETMEEMLARMPNPAGPSSPMEEAFGAFVRGFNRGRPEPEPEPEPAADDFGRLVGQMFQAGQQAQASQVQAFEQILDRFWGAGK